jgi:hypothetical protein
MANSYRTYGRVNATIFREKWQLIKDCPVPISAGSPITLTVDLVVSSIHPWRMSALNRSCMFPRWAPRIFLWKGVEGKEDGLTVKLYTIYDSF